MQHILQKIRQYGFKKSLQKSIPFFKRGIKEGLEYGRIYLWKLYNFFIRPAKNKKILYAFYDLRTIPMTFDILTFLNLATSECLENGHEGFHFVFVPGDKDGFKKNHIFDKVNNQWRMHNIMIACTRLFPLCNGVTVAITRKEAQIMRNTLAKYVFPKHYHTKLLNGDYHHDRHFERAKHWHIHDRHKAGYPVQHIEPLPKALYYIQKWIDVNAKGKKVVSISLRGALYHTEINSNTDEWIKFAKSLDLKKYHPVFVLDQETSLEPVPKKLREFDILSQASFDNILRAALYHASYLNLMVNNGPTYLAVWNKEVRFLIFKMIEENDGDPSRRDYVQPYQKYVWKEDSYDIISEEFEKMCAVIEEYEKTKKVS